MPLRNIRFSVTYCVAAACLMALAWPSRADVKKVWWGPGSPPQWREQTITSPHRIPVELSVPAGHDFITVVVETEDGKRVRNLLGQVPVSSLGISEHDGVRTVAVVWDGMNDNGEVVPDGTYYLRGLTIPRPRILYDYSFYNPNANLPWQGYGHSAWGADHTGPADVACAPAGTTGRTEVAIAGAVAENPHAVLGLNDQHSKIWGYKREGGINGISCIEYADGALWMGFNDTIVKINADSLSDIGWKRPAGRAAALTMPGEVLRVAVGAEYGAALVRTTGSGHYAPGVAGDTVVFCDKEYGTSRRSRNFPAEVTLPWPAYDLAFLSDGRLVVSTDSGVFVVGMDGQTSPCPLPGCENPRALTADDQGNLYVFDAGADWQVKVYGPDMTLVRTVGRRGGQKVSQYVMFTEVAADSPEELALDYDAFRTVSGMDVDRHGNLWVAEPMHPRMVTVWNSEGVRIDALVGNTEYGAAGTSLHEQDPALAYGYGLIFAIDPERTVPQNPTRFVTSAVTAEPAQQRLPRLPQGHYFKSGRLFRSDASGQIREYFVHNDFGYPVLYINRDGDYRPCAAAVKVAGRDSSPQFAKPDKAPGNADWYGVWSDNNSDGLVQPEEVFALPEAGGRIIDFYGMGYVFNPQLTWYLGGYAVAPTSYLDDGTPLFDAAGMQKLNADNLALRTGDYLVGDASGVFQAGHYRFADLEGNVFATYPLNAMGVHSSMHAPGPAPGETRGELCYAGAATVGGDLGPVMATQGNMGQMFVFTGDGLFVCALFKDTRYGPRPWPAEAKKGTDFTDCTMGQEPFDGCMVVQDDGKMRLVFGRTAANVCVVEGLEQAKRFGPVPVHFSLSGEVSEPAGESVEETPDNTRVLSIPPMPAGDDSSIVVDGSLEDWQDVPVRPIRAGDKEATLAVLALRHTDTHLLLGISVHDETPMVNSFADWRSAFRTGDAIDIYMGPAGDAPDTPVKEQTRLLLVPTADGAAVIRYRPSVPGVNAEDRVPFTSPIGTTYIDEVTMIDDADVVFRKTENGYACEASLPLALFGIASLDTGRTVAGDIGVIFSDGGGQQSQARNYLFNHTWTITSDLFSEAMLKPETWGEFVFEPGEESGE